MTILAIKAFDPHYLGAFEGYTALIVCSLPILLVAICRVFGIRNWDRTENPSLPPIKFALNPKIGAGTTDIIGIATEDISRSGPNWHAFARAIRSLPTPTFSSQATGESRDNGTTSFIERLKTFSTGFRIDEDQCIAEVRTTHEEEQFDEDIEKVLQGLDADGALVLRKSVTPSLRRHSMSI